MFHGLLNANVVGWYVGKPIVNTRFSIRSLRQSRSICTLLPTKSGGKIHVAGYRVIQF
jgi:hypothetical protein